MDKQVFELIHDINCQDLSNTIWGIMHSNGDLCTSGTFGDIEDKVIPEGDYIYIWLKPSEYADFIEKHKGLCWHVATGCSEASSHRYYIYKV